MRRWRIWCWLGMHAWRQDPTLPCTTWCRRPLCPAIRHDCEEVR